MNASILPIPLAQAGPIVATALGVSWRENRLSVIRTVNRIREMIYSTSPTALGDVWAPRPVWKWSGKKFATLPPGMDGVIAAYVCGESVNVHSTFRDAKEFDGASKVSVTLMPGSLPSAVQAPPGRLSLYSEHSCESSAVVSIIATDGETKRVTFPLEEDSWKTSPIICRELVSVVLPENRTGKVVLNCGGVEVSTYSPWEVIPSYQYVRLDDSCSSRVVIQGNRKFVPICYDHDIVEVGSVNFLEAMARYFRYDGSTDRNEATLSERSMKTAMGILDALSSRQKGSSMQDGLKKSRRASPFKKLR